MDIQIRRAEAKDGPAIAELLRSLGSVGNIDAETPRTTVERVTRHLAMCNADDSHSVYVAQESVGKIVGYGSVHWLPNLLLAGPEGYVSELFLLGSHRGRGIGGQILELMKAEAGKRGCSRLMLINRRSRESYQRQFYRKQGWEEREEVANFIYRLSDPTSPS